MADTTARMVVPALKMVDLGDGTYAMGCAAVLLIVGGTDTTFTKTNPPLKAVDNGDNTYSISVVAQV